MTVFISTAFTFPDNYQDPDDLIFWKENRKLTWDDFLSNSDSKSEKKAHSEIVIDIINVHLENDIPKYEIGCFFVKSKSWIRDCAERNLQQQQLHYDINELYTRKIRKAFDSLNVLKIVDGGGYQEIFEAYLVKNQLRNSQCHAEITKDAKRQKRWSKTISAEIRQLDAYAHAK